MIPAMRCARLILTLAATVTALPALAQSAPNACALLFDAEVASLINRGQPDYGDKPEATSVHGGKGSLCQYSMGQVGFWIGPDSERYVERMIKAWHQEAQPRQRVSGVGDKAYVFYPKPLNEYSDEGPYLVAAVGPHTITATLFAREGQADGMVGRLCREQPNQLAASDRKNCDKVLADKSETPESLQPAVVELAKVLVAKVRSGKTAP